MLEPSDQVFESLLLLNDFRQLECKASHRPSSSPNSLFCETRITPIIAERICANLRNLRFTQFPNCAGKLAITA